MSADALEFTQANVITLGGTSEGTATFGQVTGQSSNLLFNWLPDSQMTLSFTSFTMANWAETTWNAGRMTYNGMGQSTLGNWAAVTTPGGLGGGQSFFYDSSDQSLSIIPEPGLYALIFGIGLVGIIVLRRRRGRL